MFNSEHYSRTVADIYAGHKTEALAGRGRQRAARLDNYYCVLFWFEFSGDDEWKLVGNILDEIKETYYFAR